MRDSYICIICWWVMSEVNQTDHCGDFLELSSTPQSYITFHVPFWKRAYPYPGTSTKHLSSMLRSWPTGFTGTYECTSQDSLIEHGVDKAGLANIERPARAISGRSSTDVGIVYTEQISALCIKFIVTGCSRIGFPFHLTANSWCGPISHFPDWLLQT